MHNWGTARSTEWHAAPLWTERDADLGVAEAIWLDAAATCRCTEGGPVHGLDLAGWLAAGRRRVVVDAAL